MKQLISYTAYRFLLPVCVLLTLLLGSCREDDEDSLLTDGGRIEITNLQTRNSQDGAVAFGKDGAELNVTLTYGNEQQSAVLAYSTNAWKWKDNKPLYWQSTTENQKLTVCYIPAQLKNGNTGSGGVINFTLPTTDGWTDTNWDAYDPLSKAMEVTPATLPAPIELEHCMAMAKVTLVPGEGFDGELPDVTSVSMMLPTAGCLNLASGEVKQQAGNSAKAALTFYQPDNDKAEFYALALPGSTGTKVIEINVNGTKYQYTATTEISFTTGRCNTYTLALNKVGVAPLGLSVEEWAAGSTITGTKIEAPTGDEIILCDGRTLPTVADDKKYSIFTIYGNTISDATKSFIEAHKTGNGITLNLYTTQIPAECFKNKTYISKVYIGSLVTNIGNQAFSGVTSLTKLVISPEGNLTIGCFAFENTKIKQVAIPARVWWGTTKKFVDDMMSGGTLGTGAYGYHYFSYAFKDCTDLETVTLAEGLTSIGLKMFDGCTKLKKLTLPYSMKELPDLAFYGTPPTTSIDAPGVEEIGEFAFWNTTISELNIPKCRRLGKKVFASNTQLTKLKLADNSFDGETFTHNSSITTVVFGEKLTNQIGSPITNTPGKLAIHGGYPFTIDYWFRESNHTLFLYGVHDKTKAEAIRDMKTGRNDSWIAVYYDYTGTGGYEDSIESLTNPSNYTKLEDAPAVTP